MAMGMMPTLGTPEVRSKFKFQILRCSALFFFAPIFDYSFWPGICLEILVCVWRRGFGTGMVREFDFPSLRHILEKYKGLHYKLRFYF